MHPFLQRRELVQACQDRGIVVEVGAGGGRGEGGVAHGVWLRMERRVLFQDYWGECRQVQSDRACRLCDCIREYGLRGSGQGARRAWHVALRTAWIRNMCKGLVTGGAQPSLLSSQH